jgi:hypothetical protein
MKKYAAILGVVLTLIVGLRAAAQTPADEQLFQEAKILLFDEKWDAARAKLEALLDEYPESRLASQAVFYRAKCLAKKKDRQEEALAAYEKYLVGSGKSPSLTEEADTSIIDLSYDLYAGGDRTYLARIEDRLRSPNRVVRYYAAFKLSLVRDKSAADRAVPVLRQIVEEERDADLRDRARIALLRISPDELRAVENERGPARGNTLKIRVMVRGSREPEISLNIPWALADLALSAIPEKDRASLRAEGYDLDRIIDQLTRTKESLIEIRDADRIIKLWIE